MQAVITIQIIIITSNYNNNITNNNSDNQKKIQLREGISKNGGVKSSTQM